MSGVSNFLEVTFDEPCVLCKKPDWCIRTADGAHGCFRVSASTANGYLRIKTTDNGCSIYRLPTDRHARSSNSSRSYKSQKESPLVADLTVENDKFRAAIPDERKKIVASQLGVSVAALDSIEIGQADKSDLKRLHASGANWKKDSPSSVRSFPERDATGAIIGFSFRTDDGRKGSPSGKVGAKRGLIIPSTLSTRLGTVLLVEGSSDVAACETLGLASVGRPSNTAGGEHLAQLLEKRDVLVVGENDQKANGNWPGRDGAQKIATYLAKKWKRAVRWSMPPDENKDIRDYLRHLAAQGLDVEDQRSCAEAGQRLLESLVDASTEVQPPASSTSNHNSGAREILLQLCEEAGDYFFHNNESRPFVYVKENKCSSTWPLKSRSYAILLGRRYHQLTETVIPSTAKAEVLDTLEGLALFDGPEETIFLRIGEYADKVVLDLCDDESRVVVIDKDGWKVVDDSPIHFRRTPGMLALPMPIPGGSIDDLRPFINARTRDDFILICGYIIGCFNPRGPFMVLLVNGEPGSSKSTLCRVIRSLVDPNKAPLRCEPKGNRDLAISMNNAWMICLDNMSPIKKELSNALCRLATGGGFATRELYSDADEKIFDGMRPIMINGIGDVAQRSDLIDRAIQVTLPTIPDHQRQTERAFLSEFKKRQPSILGALLDAVSAALRNQDTVQFSVLPRMADSASWIVAAEPACPWEPGSFIAAFNTQQRDADESLCESSSLATAIRNWTQLKGNLSGTPTEVFNLLSSEKNLKHRDWPKSVSSFGAELRKIAQNLRRLGVEVIVKREGQRRSISIRYVNDPPDLPSSPSLPSHGTEKSPLDVDNGDLSVPDNDSTRPICDGDKAIGVSD